MGAPFPTPNPSFRGLKQPPPPPRTNDFPHSQVMQVA